jgi:signal transduction histidine kinase
VRTLVEIQERVAEQVAKAQDLSPLEKSDREEVIGDWLERREISGAWDLASTFVEAGLDTDWLEGIVATLGGTDNTASLGDALRWLTYAIETELLMNEIADSTTRVSSLVSVAKQYSQLDRAPFDVADVRLLLTTTLAMLSHKIQRDITVVEEFEDALPPLPCYPAELNQVWTNLIDNAVVAMRSDGAIGGTLTVRARRQGDAVRVEVCDTGPGVPADLRERIFDPFFTTKPVGEGTGLGLDYAARIVDKHGGSLWVECEPGETRFVLLLPLTNPDTQP